MSQRVHVRSAYELAMELFAGRYRACGRPFVSHLVGTASVLARHGAEHELVVAGVLHAAYEHGDFGTGRTGALPDHRRRVRDVAGSRVEDLVARYHALDTDRVSAALDVADHPLVRMRVANEIDDCLDRGLLYSGEKRYALIAPRVERFAEAADDLGWHAMAAELREAFAQNRGSLPAGLSAQRFDSFRLPRRTPAQRRRRWLPFRKRRRPEDRV